MAGEFLTRGTIWVTIVAYAIGSVSFALAGTGSRWNSAGLSQNDAATRSQWNSFARVAWTLAVISLIVHFICAFQFYHGWSHGAAYRDTARQTEEVVGLDWGGGLFINYAFLAIWIVDIGWWWLLGLDSYRGRPWPLIIIWHGLLILIIFNATVVFEDGIVRWLGLAICIGLFLTWTLVAKQRSMHTQATLEGD